MQDNHKIKAIIFDLGRVLVDFDHSIASKKISKFTNKNPQEIFSLFFDSGLTGLFEEGKISPQAFFLRIKKMLNLNLSYPEFLPIWNDIFFLTEKNRDVYKIAESLKKQYRIALLSNINILHFNYLEKKFPHLFDAFHYIITSFKVGLRKPHPLIYQETLRKLEVSAQRVFYTDDRAELVEKAVKLGIRGFVFKGAAQLKRDLLKEGININ